MSGRKDREERREQRLRQEGEAEAEARRQRLLKLGSAAAFLAIVAVAVAVVVSQSQDGGSGSLEDAGLVRRELDGIPQSGLVLGEPKAKVTLFEFGDLQCPACKSYAEEIIPDVIDSKVRSGEAKIEFRNFTIISEESTPAGAAVIAAGMQGWGWHYLELFYRNQGEEASGYVTDSFLTDLARAAKVPDVDRWDADRQSEDVLAEVARTTAEAQRLGLNSTPSFAVEGPATNGLETLGASGSVEILEAAIGQAG